AAADGRVGADGGRRPDVPVDRLVDLDIAGLRDRALGRGLQPDRRRPRRPPRARLARPRRRGRGCAPHRRRGRSVSALLEVRNLITAFPAVHGAALAANGVSFDVEEGATKGIVGESGSGKTLTLRSVLGLVPAPGRGIERQVLWRGRGLLTPTPRQRRPQP